MDVNPAHMVPVTDYSPGTLRNIIAHLEVSSEFDHLIYREAELDAIWSITGFILQKEPKLPRSEDVANLHRIAHVAHDLVAERRPAEAAAVLRSLL